VHVALRVPIVFFRVQAMVRNARLTIQQLCGVLKAKGVAHKDYTRNSNGVDGHETPDRCAIWTPANGIYHTFVSQVLRLTIGQNSLPANHARSPFSATNKSHSKVKKAETATQ
jgi:hypothetical protein